MDHDYVLSDQTVLIAGERIRDVGPAAKIVIGTETKRIDGSGAFLMPGLSDMHVHFALPATYPESYRSLNRKFALQLLASGITTVRNMRGFPELLTFRAEIETGSVIGPRIYSTGPGNNGGSAVWPFDRKIETAADANNGVNQDKANGFDAIKVYSGLSAAAYRYLVDAARRAGLPVYGHVPHAVSLDGVLNARQDSIEHLSGYLDAIQPFQAQHRFGALLRVFGHLDGTHYDSGTLRSVAKATREAGTWNCPTLVLLRSLYTRWRAIPIGHSVSKPMSSRPGPNCDATVMGRDTLEFDWQDEHFPLVVVKALHEAGARLLVGTDADGTYVVHGDSIHDELSMLVAAGLTPYQALRASTADAAEFLGKEGEFGTIAIGKRADLLLLAGDPRVDIRNANRQIGVMIRGRWFTPQDLERLLETPPILENGTIRTQRIFRSKGP
jgi:imidazolonepropionase-like amidohydrolase